MTTAGAAEGWFRSGTFWEWPSKPSGAKMRIVPFGATTVAAVTLGVLLLMFPLVLLQVPFSEVLKKLVGLIFGHVG